MRRIRPFTAWLTILLLLQAVLGGSRGLCDTPAGARSADRPRHEQHTAVRADVGAASHEQRMSGVAGTMMTATDAACSDAQHGCGRDAVPNGRLCDAAACTPVVAAPAILPALRAPMIATVVWNATPILLSTNTAPDTPPPRV